MQKFLFALVFGHPLDFSGLIFDAIKDMVKITPSSRTAIYPRLLIMAIQFCVGGTFIDEQQRPTTTMDPTTRNFLTGLLNKKNLDFDDPPLTAHMIAVFGPPHPIVIPIVSSSSSSFDSSSFSQPAPISPTSSDNIPHSSIFKHFQKPITPSKATSSHLPPRPPPKVPSPPPSPIHPCSTPVSQFRPPSPPPSLIHPPSPPPRESPSPSFKK